MNRLFLLAAVLATSCWSHATAQDAQPHRATSQDPAPGEQTVRLTYELPVDALMRSLKGNPDQDLEQLLAESIAVLRHRLGSSAKVTRHAATGFRVVLPAHASSDAQRLIESVASMEMRMLAYSDYARDGVTFDLKQESARLSAWLDQQGREKVRAKPELLKDFQPTSPHLRWSLHRIPANRGRWGYRIGTLPAGKAATAAVPLFSEEEFQRGPVPGAASHLFECVAINRHERHFDQDDLKRSACRAEVGRSGGYAVAYEVKPDRAQAYGDFSVLNKNRMCAILLKGEVVSAPLFRGRIPGRGIIEGDFNKEQLEALVTVLRSGPLPAAPKLLQREVLPK